VEEEEEKRREEKMVEEEHATGSAGGPPARRPAGIFSTRRREEFEKNSKNNLTDFETRNVRARHRMSIVLDHARRCALAHGLTSMRLLCDESTRSCYSAQPERSKNPVV
jgi:hypothetical protein